MAKPLRTFFLSFTIVALLLISAIGTTTVYADDDTGTDTTDTETTDTSQEEQPTEEVQSEETPPPSDEEAVADDQSLGDIMEQVPDNTTVTVLNSEGEALPLASQETADVIESAYDPIWCPEGTPPVPGADGCTESFSSFTDLLTYLQTNETDTAYQQAGTIYIQNNQYLGGESAVNFNDYNFNQINNYDLTLQGGWNTVDNTVNSVDTTQFSVPITIGSGTNPWVGSLTMNNISISDVLDQTALVLYSQNDITLSDVEITNSQTGADLNAGGDVTINNSKINKNKKANAVVNAGGNVNITNSTFNDSNGMGIGINSGGNVSLASVEANNNQLFGADVQAVGSVAISTGFFSGNKSANIVSCQGNGGGGDDDKDDDHKKGDKKDDDDKHSSDDDKDDNHKGDDRYSLKADDDDGKQSSKSDDDDDKHSSKDDDDDDDRDSSKDDDDDGGQTSCNNATSYTGYGLQVVTSGSISLDNVTASDNNLFGAHLEGSDIAISNSIFSNNGTGAGNEPLGKGLEINASANTTGTGSVSLFNVEANNNQLFGANIQATGSVAIGGISFFSGNKSTNIVSCQGNGNGGDDDKDDDKKDDDDKHSSDDDKDDNHKGDDRYSLKADDDDSKQSSKGDDDDKHSSKDDDDDGDKDSSKDDDGDGGQTSCNNATTVNGYGLQVVTQGLVSLDGVTASDNNMFGAHLEGASVAISNSVFNNNGSGSGNDPLGKGLEVISGSDVSISNVEANNNQLFGANIQAIGSVSISNSFFSGNKSANIVSCQGNGGGGDDDKDDDKKDDDDKHSSDDDKDDNHKGDDKYSLKADDNDSKQSSKSDDDDDKHSSKDNDDDDKHSSKDDDDDKDASKDDDDDGGQTPCNNATSYTGYGLQVVTSGSISLDNVTASDNNLFGAHLEGTDIAISNSIFSNNGSGTGNEPVGKGLEINSAGVVSLFNVEANNNQLFGANIQAIGNVIIGNSFFSGNNSANIVSCQGNGNGGDDDKDDDKKDDDDKHSSDDDKDDNHKGDDRYSLKADDDDGKQSSKGDDDDDKHSSKDDDDDGDKDSSKDDDDDDGQTSCNNATTVNGYGLQVVTQGVVSLNGVTASNNGVNGAILNSPTDITVTNSTFDSNGGTGLIVTTTSGQVTLENVTATNNGLDGVDVTGTCTTTVQIINGSYSNNAEYGLKVINATLNQSGSPEFTNNGVGSIFQDPGTCVTSIPFLANLPAASGQGNNGKIFSSQLTDYSTHYRLNINQLSLPNSDQTFKSSIFFASKMKPYKYTGALTHRGHTN